MNRQDSRIQNLLHITKNTITMQDLSSTVSYSPSFSFYASGDGGLVEAAVRAVRESQSYYSVKDDDDDDAEFEFETSPLHEESFFHFPATVTVFKRSPDEEEDDDVAAEHITSKDIFYGGLNVFPSLSSPSPSQSHSSSESDDMEDLSPSRYYCFWSPIRSPAKGDNLTSKSSSAPKRCRIKELLRRSDSDGAVSTSSEPKRCRFKNLLRRSHSEGGLHSTVVKGKNKTPSYKPTKTREVDMRRKTYLPYRQDLIGVFAGMSRFRH